MPTLHITNGTAVITHMRDAAIPGQYVPWDDVLHEGPVPAGLNTAALRSVRADFLASWVAQPRDVVEQKLRERDEALDKLSDVDEIVLWFEHDLYDQLQLIQVLDRLAPRESPLVSAVPGDTYLADGDCATLFAARRPITSSQRLAARDGWDAFRSADPRSVVQVMERVSDLPHLAPALRRHLEQFPSRRNGLSRTEQQTLEAVASGVSSAREVYTAANREREDAVFMGDLAFLFHIRGLVESRRPLLTRVGRTSALSLADGLALTEDGTRVLAGEADRVALCGIDRWLGGVHLAGNRSAWRWDTAQAKLRAEASL